MKVLSVSLRMRNSAVFRSPRVSSSSNGTWLNGKRLESNRDASVKPGDRLEIGSKKERFEVQ